MLIEKIVSHRTKEELETRIRSGICANVSYLLAIAALEQKTSVFYVENLLKEMRIKVPYEEIKKLLKLRKNNLWYMIIGFLDFLLILVYLFSLVPFESDIYNSVEFWCVLGSLMAILVVLSVLYSIYEIKEKKLLLKLRRQISDGPATILEMFINLLKNSGK